jgi:hypothetical protein
MISFLFDSLLDSVLFLLDRKEDYDLFEEGRRYAN